MKDNIIYEIQPQKVYAFLAKHNVWAVSDSDDSGLNKAMLDIRADTQIKPVPGKPKTVHKIWLVPNDSFQNIKPLLDTLGYAIFSAPPAPSASFQVPASGKTEQPSPVPCVEHTYSIAELSKEIKGTINAAFCQKIWVRGEICGLKSPNPHLYFDLIDSTSHAKSPDKLKAIIWADTWRMIAQKIQENRIPKLAEGMEIRVAGTLNYYAPGSQVSFCIQDIDEQFAEGEFYRRKAEIEAKLRELGIHDKNAAIPMPVFPGRLAVFSNQTAAGWRDFVTELQKEGFPFRITLFQVGLQGNHLEPSFLNAFKALSHIGFDQFDLGIIIRGGGGVTELGGFNSFPIAEFIANCPLKFVIGVGHEEDRTVLDEIALRHKTPTAVAQALNEIMNSHDLFLHTASQSLHTETARILTETQNALQQHAMKCANALKDKHIQANKTLSALKNALKSASLQRCHEADIDIRNYQADIRLAVHRKTEEKLTYLRMLQNQIAQNAQAVCANERQHLDSLKSGIKTASDLRIHTENAGLRQNAAILRERTNNAQNNIKMHLDILKDKLALLDPRKQFERGFVVLTGKSGKSISKIQDVSLHDKLTVRLIDGHVDVTVDSIRD